MPRGTTVPSSGQRTGSSHALPENQRRMFCVSTQRPRAPANRRPLLAVTGPFCQLCTHRLRLAKAPQSHLPGGRGRGEGVPRSRLPALPPQPRHRRLHRAPPPPVHYSQTPQAPEHRRPVRSCGRDHTLVLSDLEIAHRAPSRTSDGSCGPNQRCPMAASRRTRAAPLVGMETRGVTRCQVLDPRPLCDRAKGP